MSPSLSLIEIIQFAFRFILETILLFLVFRYLYLIKDITKIFQAFSKRVRCVLILFFSIWTLVHVTDRFQYHFPQPYGFYPFTRFAMYQHGRKKNYVDTYEITYVAEQSNTRSIFNPAKEFSAIGLPSINTRFRVIAEAITSSNKTKEEWAKNQIELIFLSIKRYLMKINSEYPEKLLFKIKRYDTKSGYDTDKFDIVYDNAPSRS